MAIGGKWRARLDGIDRVPSFFSFQWNAARYGSAYFALLIACLALCAAGMSGCGGNVVVNSSNSVVFQVSPSPATFGTVTVGQSATLNITLKNETLAAVTISQISLSGESFTITSKNALPVTVASGGTYTISAQFAPTSAGGATGQLSVTSDAASSATTVALTGTGTEATTAVGGLTCASSSITGLATDACTVTLGSAAPSGGEAVSLSSNNAAVTVPSSATVTAGATSTAFTAAVAAVSTAQTATLTATANGVSTTFALQLNAAPASLLNINATSIAFGNVVVNSSATQTVTLTSAGTGTTTVNSATLTGAGFTLSGSSFPATLNPGEMATLNVTFAPAAAGAFTGSLAIAGTASTATIPLSGTGESVAVALAWNAPANSTDPVVGYNVYRAADNSSAYSKINSSTQATTKYTDTALQSGTTYVYYVTSVDAEGAESAPSNTATATVP